MKNKVKFGLKNVHVWPITDDASTGVTYGQVIKVPGAVTLTLDAEGERDPFYADDIIYYETFSNNGYSGSLEIALIPEEFEIAIMGNEKDENGAIVENINDKSVPYAMAFEFDGDKTQTRHMLYNCLSSRPKIEGETKQGRNTPKTDVLTLSATAAKDTGHVRVKLTKGSTGYDTFFETPYVVKPVPGV